MQPSSKRRLVGVVVLVWFLALGITARSFAAPSSGQTMLQGPPATGSATASSTATTTQTASPTATPDPPLLVISQVYGGGGGSGAAYQNDFVEIFNRGAVPVSLSGLSIQVASATGADLFSGSVTVLSGTIMPGKYYLVQMAGGAIGTPMPAPDATGTAKLATGGGKVILADDVAGLPCNAGTLGSPLPTRTGTATPSLTPTSTSTPSVVCSASDLAKILDLVGYGTANFSEGGAPAPAHNNTTADFRASNGCTDTGNNGADFATAAAAPRNSSSSAHFCVPTATPTDTATVTATATDTQTASETATSADTGTATMTDTATVTDTATITNTGTLTITATNTLTITLTPSATTSSTVTSTSTVSPTRTLTPTATLTPSETATSTDTGTATDTATSTNTATFTVTATITLTPTDTGSATVTSTSTVSPTRTLTPTAVAPRAVVINEVAWAGTIASADDEWIELYNSTGSPINLAGWKLVAADGSPSIDLSGQIPGLSYFLLERCDDNTVSDIAADIVYACSLTLSNSGEALRLLFPTGAVIDTANGDGGGWPAGLAGPNYNSMERRTGFVDSSTAWITNTGVLKNGHDANGNAIYGTPKQVNWANFVTPTPSPTASRTPTPTRTFAFSTVPPSHDFVVLNEFLPQPSTDWNQDGVSDTDDEYIEIMNIGTAPVNLFGWKLDDADPSTPAFAIPGQLLSQGQRLAYFANDTGLQLSDGGGSVRLYRQTVVVDSFTYPVVTRADIAWCRLPDGTGAWVFGCNPTPDQPNQAAEGLVPGATPAPTPPPSGEAPPPVSSLCLLQAEDWPPSVYTAECYIPGLGVWNPDIWDASSQVFGPLAYYPPYSKWEARFE